jgi:hypothetical protein
MPNCCEKRDPPTCPYHSNWRSAGYFGDHMNWLLILCDPDIMEHSNGRLAQCESVARAPLGSGACIPGMPAAQALDHNLATSRFHAGTKEPNAPTSYCFTSGETNWSNNPILFPRTWFNDKIRDIALMDFERNNMFGAWRDGGSAAGGGAQPQAASCAFRAVDLYHAPLPRH